eukprot:CCRYP_020191-RA/>CCRYP_020191-RA protein AED:0.03 eAED:0.03 QI:100/1/1/1/0.33/0.25/4/1464/410
MAVLKILSAAASVLFTHRGVYANNAAFNANGDEALISNLIQWVRANGGYVNDKISFRRFNLGDPISPRGVFATQEIDEGETLANIPWDIIIKSPERARGEVEGWSKDDCGVIQETMKVMAASAVNVEGNPYGRYLLSQPHNYTVGFWSNKGQELFVEMTDDFLPPNSIDDMLLWEFKDACGGDVNDPIAVQAAMLVRARSDWEYMVPIYDLFNHDNGKYNIQHKYNPYKSSLEDTGYEVIASRKIYPGEQLYNSYNRCNICEAYYDWFGTPEVYLHFGFVESYPQRWLFDLARVKADLIVGNDGRVGVKFLVPPSQKGIEMLRKQLIRLNDFGAKYGNRSAEEVGVRGLEWSSLWQYYGALRAALTYITESKEMLVDDVWKMDDNWWVQEGTTRAGEDEHWVRTSTRDEL